MEISKYIYDYLVEYKTSIVVPDLGCFSIVQKPSEIKDGVALPPVKTVAFDSENTEDDNIFTYYVAKKEGITSEQAAEEVRKFYNKYFIQKLTIKRETISFAQFGTFLLVKGNIIFEPVSDIFKDNFGLGNGYISGETKKQPAAPVAPKIEPPKPVSVKPPAPVPLPVKPEPVTKPAPIPVPVPVQAKPEPVMPPIVPIVKEPEPSFKTTSDLPVSTPAETQNETQPVQPKADSGESLFNLGDNTRYRENTERRRPAPAVQRHEPPVSQQQARKKEAAKPPRVQKREKERKEKKEKSQKKSHGWVLWILLIAAILGVGGYYGYPYIKSYIPEVSTITSFFQKEKAEEVEPEETPTFDEDEDAFAADSLNVEIIQGLEDATDKRVALNPDDSQPTTVETPQTTPASTTPAATPSTPAAATPSTPATATPSTPAAATPSTPAPSTPSTSTPPATASASGGRYEVIIGSFGSNSAAESFGRSVQSEGITFRVVNFNQQFRVSAGGFSTYAEAINYLNQISSQRQGQVWIWDTRR